MGQDKDAVMDGIGRKEYLKLCIRYRLLSVLCSTAAYMIRLPRAGHGQETYIIVAAGMMTACAVGTFLYKRTFFEEKDSKWLFLTLLVELVAYGVFICLSGGVSSPYLWYFTGCLFLMAAAGRYHFLLVAATAWCVLCIVLGGWYLGVEREFSHSDMNTVIGILVVSGGLYTLQRYMRCLEESRKETEILNRHLAKEKAATEQALCRITDLYDTVNLFMMTNQRQGMDEMARLLSRSLAPGGCLLLKLKMEESRSLDWMSSYGLEEHTIWAIIGKLKEMEWNTALGSGGTFEAEGRPFTAIGIGKGIFIPGVLVIAASGKEAGGTVPEPPGLSFYVNLVETVYKNMDMQKILEEGIIRDEQHRIANEIHDTVLQKLFGISCSLKVLEHAVGTMGEDEVSGQLRCMEQSIRLTMQELREAIYGIRFGENSGSFEDKLRVYMTEAGRLGSVLINLDMKGDFGVLPAGQKTVLYRIVCEAVNNAVRHGKAGRIDVDANAGEDGIRVTVTDNGAGFKPGAFVSSGSGMKNMHRLASLMGGTCTVDSEMGRGTKIQVFLPRYRMI